MIPAIYSPYNESASETLSPWAYGCQHTDSEFVRIKKPASGRGVSGWVWSRGKPQEERTPHRLDSNK